MVIEKLTKKRVQVETILWDGTDERAAEIKEWVGQIPDFGDFAFTTPKWAAEAAGVAYREEPGDEDAWLWVAHNKSWSPLPVGYRVAAELDGSGFYPLSPDGAQAGYEMPGETP